MTADIIRSCSTDSALADHCARLQIIFTYLLIIFTQKMSSSEVNHGIGAVMMTNIDGSCNGPSLVRCGLQR